MKRAFPAILLGCLASASPVLAAEGTADFIRAMKPFAKAGVSYDSNLFRLRDKDTAQIVLGKRELSDLFLTVGGGVDGSIDVSQQNFVIQGEIYRNVYDEYSTLDYTEANADLIWNWKIGERWDGELGYLFDRDRQDFANQNIGQTPEPNDRIDNIRTRNNIIGQANFLLTREWKLYGRGKATDISFDKRQELLNLKRSSVGLGADYTTAVGNRIGVDADFLKGRYDTNKRLDYDEYNVGPTANWEVSGKTRVRGKIDYTNRKYDDVSQEDFDGITWRFTFVRNPGEETNTEAAIYREISTLNDDISNYAEIDGVSIAPAWKLTGRLLLKLLGSYEIRDFKGRGDPSAPPPAPGTPQRKDKVATAAASVDWEMTRALTLSGSYRFEDRSSNSNLEEYDYNLVEISIRGGF